MRYNFSHEQLVELHSGVKNGTWVNHEVRMELIKLFEDYFIELATSPLYKITKNKLGEEKFNYITIVTVLLTTHNCITIDGIIII